MPTVTLREYNPESGALLGNVTTFKFGRVSSGTSTRVKVIDIAFTDATYIGNLKLGLIANAGITVNADPNGSASNGNFGIEVTPSFDSSKASAPLTRHFAGLNGTSTANNTNNVSIGTRSGTVSNYIYLDIKTSSSASSVANGAYKIFFDYS